MDTFDELSEWMDESARRNGEMRDKAMRITEGKGFHLDLPNGVTVSVQFGPMNYCDQDVRNAGFDAPAKAAANGEQWGSNLAECAAYLTGSNLSWVAVPGFTGPIGDEDVETFYDDVSGYMTVQDVLDFINLASQLVNPEANEKSLGNRMLSSLEHGDYRDDPKLQEDERKVMEEDPAPSDQFPYPLPGQKELDFDDA